MPDLEASIAELRRCVEELGFVGCNLNPDPSGGFWTSPPLTDRSWYPLYEALIELDVPAMVHVSASATPVFHGTGAYYINADTTAFMQLLQGNLFGDLPDLRLVIPHGGGAVPYHWGRYRGLADMLKQPPVESNVMGNVFFDTCVYHQPGHRPPARRDRHPEHPVRLGDGGGGPRDRRADGSPLRRHPPVRRGRVREGALDDEARAAVFEHNVRRVYPRLAGALAG